MARKQFNRIFNISEHSYLKPSQAEERVSSCLSVWVDEKSIRNLNPKEQKSAIDAKFFEMRRQEELVASLAPINPPDADVVERLPRSYVWTGLAKLEAIIGAGDCNKPFSRHVAHYHAHLCADQLAMMGA
jgi:hypothetical protein